MDKTELVERARNIVKKSENLLKEGWQQYLDQSYIPPKPRHRENEILQIAVNIFNLIKGRATQNLLIHGASGSGKTMSFLLAKDIVAKLLEEEGINNYKLIYIRSDDKGGLSAVLQKICMKLGIDAPDRGISIGEYLNKIAHSIETSGQYVHICIDEFDNLLQLERRHYETLLYFLTRTVGLSGTLITNKMNIVSMISDPKVLSTFDYTNAVFFAPYTKEQVVDILKERIELAFEEGVITDEALDTLAQIVTEESGDIRIGLRILNRVANKIQFDKVSKVDRALMKKIAEEVLTQEDVDKITRLSLSDKLILVALYVLKYEGHVKVKSSDVFGLQDSFRGALGMNMISKSTFSAYLTRLQGLDIINLKKKGKGRGGGMDSYLSLNVSMGAIANVLKSDESLTPLRPIVENMLEEVRATRKRRLRDYGLMDDTA